MGRRFKRPREPKGPKYADAPEVQELAKKQIEDHHGSLVEARIVYLYRNGKWTSKGRTVLGKSKLAAEDARFVGNYDFIIIINLEAWNRAGGKTREAMVDHYLTCCNREVDRAGNNKWGIAEPDVHEFISIVRRHGVWEEELQKLMKAAKEGPFIQEGPHNEISMFEAAGQEAAGQETEANQSQPSATDQDQDQGQVEQLVDEADQIDPQPAA